MKALVEAKPDAAVLSLDSLGGAAGVNAANMTLRALSIPAVVALEDDNPEIRFQVEMETDFAHFVSSPITTQSLSAAIDGAMGFSSRLPEARAAVPTSPSAQPVVPSAEPGRPTSSSQRVTRPMPAEPAPQAPPTAAGFFGPAVGDEHLAEITSRETTETMAVGAENDGTEDEPSVPAESPREAGDSTASEGERSTWNRDSVTAVAVEERSDATPRTEELFSAEELELEDIPIPQVQPRNQRSATITARRPPVPERPRPMTGQLDVQLEPEIGLESLVDEDDLAVLSAPVTARPTPAAPVVSAGIPTDVGSVSDRAAALRAAEAEIASARQAAVQVESDEEPIALPDESGASARSAAASGASPVAGFGVNPRRSKSGSNSGAHARFTREPSARFTAKSDDPVQQAGPDRPQPGSQSGDVRAISGASGRVAAESTRSGTALSVDLPDPNSGSLQDVSVPQVLYTLCVARATGELTLETASLSRRVVFFEGALGTVFQVPNADDERKLLSTFGWMSGSYEFAAKEVPEAQFHTFGEPMELIFRGVLKHYGLNESATALGPHMKHYMVATDQASRFRRILGMEGVGEFTKAADGSKTLEQLMMSGGADTEALLRNAYFAWLTGAVVCTETSMPAPVPVEFVVPEIGSSDDTEAQPRRRTVTLSPSSAGPTKVDSVVPSPERVDSHRETFERLGHQWNVLSSRDAHEVFSLKPGCGVDEVNRRFYELVREYHPDRYARIQNAQVRSLAEKVFVQIRNVHTQLLASEKAGPADTPGGSAESFERVPTDASGAQSSVQRRRRRSTLTSQIPSSGAFRPVTSPDGASTASRGPTPPPNHQVGQSQKVGDVLDRLRTRASTTDPTGAPLATSVRKMKPDQLVRNAKTATERGNFEKAQELLELAMARGASGALVDSYALFLGYALKRVRPETAIEGLVAKAGEISDDGQRIERSQILTLAGHACRLEERPEEAIKHYQRASKEWADNESAALWLRHLRRRQADDDKKKPFSSSFLNKLFTPKSK